MSDDLARIASALERIADAADLWAKPAIHTTANLLLTPACERCGIRQSRCGTQDCPMPPHRPDSGEYDIGPLPKMSLREAIGVLWRAR